MTTFSLLFIFNSFLLIFNIVGIVATATLYETDKIWSKTADFYFNAYTLLTIVLFITTVFNLVIWITRGYIIF